MHPSHGPLAIDHHPKKFLILHQRPPKFLALTLWYQIKDNLKT